MPAKITGYTVFTIFRFGAGNGPIWLDDVMCQGNQYFIQNCQNSGWGENNCIHAEDAGVVCQRKCLFACLSVSPFVCSLVSLKVYNI